MTTEKKADASPGPGDGRIPDFLDEERMRELEQMSQDVDDGLYDDILDPFRMEGARLITDQLPDGYAYDYEESRIVRFRSDLPDFFIMKGEAGNEVPAPAPVVVSRACVAADPDRYETRTEPDPVPECEHWRAHIRRKGQIWKDYEKGVYPNAVDPLTEEAIRFVVEQLPEGYAYDRREGRLVRFDAGLPDAVSVRYYGKYDQRRPVPDVVDPARSADEPDRYETRDFYERRRSG